MEESRPLSVTLFIPTLNEVGGLRQLAARLNRGWCDQILVVDGNSVDGTAEFARSQEFEVLVQSRPGLRFAYNEGFPRVRGDIVITFSPDGNCVPELIPDLVARMHEGYDMVIASRYTGGAKSEDDDAVTGIGNRVFTKLINRLHGGRYTDAMGIYRAYRTRVFYELDLDKDDAYAMEKWLNTVMGVEVLLSVRAAKAGLRISDVPGDEPKRIAGIRKLQVLRWGMGYLLQVLREAYYWQPGVRGASR